MFLCWKAFSQISERCKHLESRELFQYKDAVTVYDFHYKYKTVSRPCYLYNTNPNEERSSLYWDGALISPFWYLAGSHDKTSYRILTRPPALRAPWAAILRSPSTAGNILMDATPKLNHFMRNPYSDVTRALQCLNSPATQKLFHKRKSCALPLMWGIHRWMVDPLHNGPVIRNASPCHDVIKWSVIWLVSNRGYTWMKSMALCIDLCT